MAKPISCPRCARENDPSFVFCLDCGRPLRAIAGGSACPGCGAPLDPGFRFCGACGMAAGERPPAPRAAAPTGSPHAARPVSNTAARGAAPRLRLTLVRSDGTPGASFPLDASEVVCGRAEGAVRLADDPTVSPRHARFTRREGRLSVEDLGSVNGTFVRLRAPRRLASGAELRVGRQLLRLEPLPRAADADRGGVRPWGSPDPGYRLRLAQLLEDGGLGEIFPLREGENALGREAGDVTFPSDRYVSARHARVEVRGSEATIVDLGSSNGTFVRIAAATPLARGDQLLVGGQLLRVDGG